MTVSATGGSHVAPLVRALALTFACSLSLRTVIAAIGAGAEGLERELGGGGAVTGTASTVLVAVTALGSPVALQVQRRLGQRVIVSAGLALTALAHVVLLLAPASWAVWAAVTTGGLGAGLLVTVLPAVVRGMAPRHVGAGVGVMMVGGQAGFFFTSFAVPWAAVHAGSWRHAAIPLALIALAGLVAWAVSPTARVGRASQAGTTGLTMRAAFALPWVRIVTAYLAIQSVVVFGQVAWLVPTAASMGVPATQAGAMLAVFGAVQVVSGTAAPLLAQRLGALGPLCTASAGVLASGVGLTVLTLQVAPGADGLVVASPPTGLLWVAVITSGLGHGAAFALVNYAIADLSGDSREAVATGAAVMLTAQLAGSLGPLAVGSLRDASGGYLTPWLLLTALSLTLVGLGAATQRTVSRRRTRRGDKPVGASQHSAEPH